MLPTNNNPPASRVHRSDSESSDDGGKSPLPVRRLSNTSVSTETGGASGGSEPGPPKVPGFLGELQGALTRNDGETEEGAPPPPPKTAHPLPGATMAETGEVMKDAETGGASGSSYSRPASPTQREQIVFSGLEPLSGPSARATSSLRFQVDPANLATREAVGSLGVFLNNPSRGNLKVLMLNAINILDKHDSESTVLRHYCGLLNSCLRNVSSESPLKGIIQRHIGPLKYGEDPFTKLKGAYQGIIDDLR